MRKGTKPYMAAAILLTLLLLTVVSVSLTRDIRKGSIDINISNPRGVPLRGMEGGDSIEGSYSSDSELTVYLLTASEAEDLREPSYYGEPFVSEGIHEGTSGRFRGEFPHDGDFEILFWNGSFTRVHTVTYRIDLGPRYTDRGFQVSIVSILVLASLLWTILLVKNRRSGLRTRTPLDERR